MSFPNFTAEKVIIELFANHPKLYYVYNEVNESAANPGTFATEFTDIVKHAFGRYLDVSTFKEVDWEYIAAILWTDEENEEARKATPVDETLLLSSSEERI